jgi:hypothetical protein
MDSTKLLKNILKALVLIVIQFFIFAGMYDLGYIMLGNPKIWGIRAVIDIVIWITIVVYVVNAFISLIYLSKPDSLRKLFITNVSLFGVSSIFIVTFFQLWHIKQILLLLVLSLLISCFIPFLVKWILGSVPSGAK